MNWRATTRRLLPYLVASAAGFLLAYLVVFAFVFPAGAAADDGRAPAVAGLDDEDAERRLREAGYTAARGLRRYNARAAEGTVLSQSPAAGTELPRGATVTLDVSAGEQTAEVPPVIGASEQQARAIIETAGLTVGDVRQEPSNAVDKGAVAAADPPPGSRVRVPARVDLVVSSGRSDVHVPVLVGRPLADAQRMVAEAGLTLGDVTVDPRAVYLPNTVVLQDPGAGERVGGGSVVRLVIAGINPGAPR